MSIVNRLRKFILGNDEKNKTVVRVVPSIVRIDTDVADYWSLDEIIGDGAFGNVYKAINKLDPSVVAAAKAMELEDDEGTDVMVEVAILINCKHPNIVELYDAFTMGNRITLLLEFCGGGAVDNIMLELSRGLTEAQIQYIMLQILKALNFIHSKNVIHRDLKAGNVLLTYDAKVKLADFGVSALCKDSREVRTTFIGTPYWMAPEVMICETFPERHYNKLADIWSFGITLIEMAEEKPPYAEMNPAKVIFKVIKADPPTFSQPKLWSAGFKDVVSRCLVKEPSNRCSAADLLMHPFFIKSGDVHCVRSLISEMNADQVLTEVVEEEYEDDDDCTSVSTAERIETDSRSGISNGETVGSLDAKSGSVINAVRSNSPSKCENELQPLSIQSDNIDSSNQSVPKDAPFNFVSKSLTTTVSVLDVGDLNSQMDATDHQSAVDALSALDQALKLEEVACDSDQDHSEIQRSSTQNLSSLKCQGSIHDIVENIGQPVTVCISDDGFTIRNDKVFKPEDDHSDVVIDVHYKKTNECAKSVSFMPIFVKEKANKTIKRSSPSFSRNVHIAGTSDSQAIDSTSEICCGPNFNHLPVCESTSGTQQPPTSSKANDPSLRECFENVTSNGLLKKKPFEAQETAHPKDEEQFLTAPPPEPPVDYDDKEAKPISVNLKSKSEHVGSRNSPHRQTVTKKTRVYVVDGVQMTSTSHQVFGVKQDYELRKQQLHDLRRLQREEARQQRELNSRAELLRNEQAKRFANEKENVMRFTETELQALARSQKRQSKECEDMHGEDMKHTLKRIQTDQERELRAFKESQKLEQKKLKMEYDLLPKSQRKEAYRLRKEQLDNEQQKRESFSKSREASEWDLEEKQLNERHVLNRQELKDRFYLQRTQMLARHQRELDHMRKVNEMNEDEAVRLYANFKKKLPKDFRTESKTRIAMFKESLRISCQKDDPETLNEKMRAFEDKEKIRVRNALVEHDSKYARKLKELRERNMLAIHELEEIHNEKRKMLLEAEQSKMEVYEKEYEQVIADWKAGLPMRKQILESEFTRELDEVDAFYRKESAHLQLLNSQALGCIN